MDISSDSIRKILTRNAFDIDPPEVLRPGQLVFKDSVVFRAGVNRFILEAVTPDERAVLDTFDFFVPGYLGYTP